MKTLSIENEACSELRNLSRLHPKANNWEKTLTCVSHDYSKKLLDISMNIEIHTSLIITVLIWAIGSSLSLLIFRPIAAIISTGVGFITTKILKTVDFKALIINAFISIPLGSLVIFTLDHLGYTQPEWQAALYLVTAVHIFAFYFGGIIFLWQRRISRHNS